MSSPQSNKFFNTVSSDLKNQTIAAPITGVGRSAIAVIAIAGPRANEVVQACFTPASSLSLKADQVRYGTWGDKTDTKDAIAAESVVLTPIAEKHLEIHCHGGVAAIHRIVTALAAQGVKIVSAAEFARGHQPLLLAEATEMLSRCTTAKFASIAMDQVRGSLLDWATEQPRRLAVSVNHGNIDAVLADIAVQASGILERGYLTSRLDLPWRVVLVGPPNVGKSSLVNAIVGFNRSITTDIAGTTRDVLHAETVVDGIPLKLSDTAGLRVSEDPIEQEGVTRARREILSADLVIQVGQYSDQEPSSGSSPSGEPEATANRPTLRIFNKSDLIAADTREDLKTQHPNALLVSAKTGDGLPELLRRMVSDVESKLPGKGEPATINQRQQDLIDQIAKAPNAKVAMNALRDLIGQS
ncbi:tRNA modification GTPase MnmE [Rubripirellula amarantea]|uniref:tRNA modification GTPase MnmE n=1 Tax=Rubripirellula amarantea TaxID=2527999 RepID=A0A5C5WTP0_9BACT|nr:GTPase [Rubripirellula amarantea]TWT54046.1 tRNA modification GTPase MnmE [Rubripirellula amarantea]